MKHCPCCGSVKIEPNNLGGDTCLREDCNHIGRKPFRDLYKGTSPMIPGVAIGAGCYWIRPHARPA